MSLPTRRRLASWALLLYLAVSLSVMVSQQASKIATTQTHNPYLFTAHFSAETYRALDTPFKPRLFAYLLASPFIDGHAPLDQLSYQGLISATDFERLVARWTFCWFLVTLLLFLATDRPLLLMFGTTAGVSFGYSLQGMVYPYDLPALFFATLATVAAWRGRGRWLPAILGIGTGFKETLIVFSALAYFGGRERDSTVKSRQDRLRALGVCLLVCLAVLTAIDIYSGRGPTDFETSTVASEEEPSRMKLLINLELTADPGNWVLFVNAGLALPLLLLPAGGDRLALGFRVVGLLFTAGLFTLAQVTEYRIFFELIPICLYNVTAFLERQRYEKTFSDPA